MISCKVTVVSGKLTASILEAHVDNKFLVRSGQRVCDYVVRWESQSCALKLTLFTDEKLEVGFDICTVQCC